MASNSSPEENSPKETFEGAFKGSANNIEKVNQQFFETAGEMLYMAMTRKTHEKMYAEETRRQLQENMHQGIREKVLFFGDY